LKQAKIKDHQQRLHGLSGYLMRVFPGLQHRSQKALDFSVDAGRALLSGFSLEPLELRLIPRSLLTGS